MDEDQEFSPVENRDYDIFDDLLTTTTTNENSSNWVIPDEVFQELFQVCEF